MALSGQLSDLSLAELIEFFCNQRKTGRLKVAYELTPGYFYFDRGDLVDAKIGSLNGIEAIYYALTLANASFKFSPAFEPTRRTIHQPWTQVTLEGLRRLDEGIKPKAPFAEEGVSYVEDPDGVNETAEAVEFDSESGVPLSMMVDSAAGGGRSKMIYAAVGAAVIALVAIAGIPAGWYGKGKAAAVAQPVASAPAPEAQAPSASPDQTSQPEQATADPNSAEAAASVNEANALAAKRAREARDRARMAEAAAARQAATDGQPAGAEVARKPEAAKPGPKM
ncbi:MAG TPA: DUF4388 domain-containing protein, partial [Pyrinomonadaceae bacterium]|nr:DUF4388 domain-containing protein [Pyrinomonadaceae bacterium]